MAETSELAVPLAEHPHLDALAQLVLTAALSAADERRAHFSDGMDELVEEAGLTADDCMIGDWDLLETLRETADAEPEACFQLSYLVARGVGERVSEGNTDMLRLASQVCWLSAHTPIDPLGAMEAQAKLTRDRGWLEALGEHIAALQSRGTGRAEALYALMALRRNDSKAGRAVMQRVVEDLIDPSLREAMAEAETAPAVPFHGSGATEVVIDGQVAAPPPGTVLFLLQALTGWLLLRRLGGNLLRWLLRVQRPVTVRVTTEQVSVESSLYMLGRSLRTRQKMFPLTALSAVTKVQSASGVGLSIGVGALALGSYVGFGLVTEAAIFGSPSLVGLGALVVFTGVLLDWFFQRFLPVRMGRHCLVFSPSKGPAVAVHATDNDAVRHALDLIREG